RQDDYGHRLLVRSRRRVWTGASHPLARQTIATLEDIAAHPYIMLTVDDADAAALRHWPDTPALQVAMRTSSLAALRGLVAYGFGVSILSDLVYRPWSLEGKKIVAIPISAPVAPMDVGLLWPRGKEPAGLVDVFRQFLIHACESEGQGMPAAPSSRAGARPREAGSRAGLFSSPAGERFLTEPAISPLEPARRFYGCIPEVFLRSL